MGDTMHSFDSACLELAEHFLADDPSSELERDDLAQAIQDAVEAWFAGRPESDRG